MHSPELATLLQRALETRLRELLAALAMPDWPTQPEPLHQVRVASRRARAVLDLTAAPLPGGWRRQARKLRKLTRALGGPRELDVHGERLAALQPALADPLALAALDHAQEHLAAQAETARVAMLKALGKLSLKRLPKLLEGAPLAQGRASKQRDAAVWACLAPWLKGLFPIQPALLNQEDAQALHDLRIRIKRLRYALEITANAFAVAPGAQLEHLKALQQALGDHHDLTTLAAALAALQEGLLARNRVALATGLTRVLEVLTQERLAALERFQRLGRSRSSRTFAATLRKQLHRPKGEPAQ